MRDLQRHTVDAIKRHALVLALRSPRAQRHILTEYLWSEEAAESTALDRALAGDRAFAGDRAMPGAPAWLAKLVTRQLADEQRHAGLLRERLAELGAASTPPPPAIVRLKLWWLDRACAPYDHAFAAGPVVVLLAVAAQLEATGVRVFGRHLAVLDEHDANGANATILREILADEKRHAKSCAAAVERLVRDDERVTLAELRERIATVDRSFGVTIAIGFWVVVAANALRDRKLPRAASRDRRAS